jgi:hypothetical protein
MSEGAMTKTLLVVTATVEATVGIALLGAPALLASILLGAPPDTVPGLIVARLAGAALLSLGAACWFAGRDAQSRAAAGVVHRMPAWRTRREVFEGREMTRKRTGQAYSSPGATGGRM